VLCATWQQKAFSIDAASNERLELSMATLALLANRWGDKHTQRKSLELSQRAARRRAKGKPAFEWHELVSPKSMCFINSSHQANRSSPPPPSPLNNDHPQKTQTIASCKR
jgi:hypothetical protein